MEIRVAEVADWRAIKAVRLQALQHEPMAFASTYAREAAFDDEVWQTRLTAADTFVAYDHGHAVGIVTASSDPQCPDLRHLTAMYVAPAARGRGIGAGLVAAVAGHAQDHGFSRVRLHVVEQNTAARRLYERAGFRPTGATMTLPHMPGVTEIELELSTGAASIIEPVSDPG